MEVSLKFALPVIATLLLPSCGSLPGDSRITWETTHIVIGGIRQLEKNLYHCEPSAIVIRDTRLDQASREEIREEWIVSSCAGDEHSYLIAYKPEKTEALIFHEETERSGSTTEVFWSTPGYDDDNYLIKELIRKFDQTIELARFGVLNESPETEALLQKGKGEQYGGKHWLSLCDTPDLKFEALRIGKALQSENAMRPDQSFETTHCYKWYGTRHDWKEMILRKSCLNDCRQAAYHYRWLAYRPPQ